MAWGTSSCQPQPRSSKLQAWMRCGGMLWKRRGSNPRDWKIWNSTLTTWTTRPRYLWWSMKNINPHALYFLNSDHGAQKEPEFGMHYPMHDLLRKTWICNMDFDQYFEKTLLGKIVAPLALLAQVCWSPSMSVPYFCFCDACIEINSKLLKQFNDNPAAKFEKR